MQVSFNSVGNLGMASTFQAHQRQNSFNIEIDKVDSKQEKIEASREKYAEFVQSCNNIYQEATPTQLVNKQTNSINITNGVYYHLGSVNGKPLNGTALTGGGFNSNFSPMIQWTGVGTKVTPEQEAAFRIHQSYSQVERQEANELVAVFMSLSRLAEGKKSVASMNDDVMFKQHFPKFAEGVGLDLSKPFTINGKSFMYSKGVLQAVNNEV
ncbi:hypothetical protein [Lysinibacillus sp. FSL K6-4013]|uniref:hypothetical protein n=1 Tax=Lysinibacillus sp. FSL K6-4013 TaxID=2921504 RepID=UPI003159DCD5